MEQLPALGRRRILAGNRFFDLVEEEIAGNSGAMYPYFTVASKWDAVIVVPVLPDGRLLVERIYRHPYRRWVDEFPAGGIEPGEDPCAAGSRELTEETGWVAGRVRPLQRFEALPGLLRMRLHIVLAEDLRQDGAISHEEAEFISVRPLTIDEAWTAAGAETASSFLTMGLLALGRDATCRSA